MEFIEYAKCSTCKKAKKYLDDNNIKYKDRSIVEDVPTIKELKDYIYRYDIDIKKLFNTSGMKYRELKLKDKLKNMSDEDKIKLLSSDGMLIKRPLLIDNEKILIGFNLKEWNEYFEK